MDSFEVKKEVPFLPKSDLKNDEIIEKSHSAYCTLCKVLLRVGALDDHLNGKKHNWKIKDQKKSKVSKMASTNFIITDPTKIPYYCALCQVSCGSKNEHVKHLAGNKITVVEFLISHIAKWSFLSLCRFCEISFFLSVNYVDMVQWLQKSPKFLSKKYFIV